VIAFRQFSGVVSAQIKTGVSTTDRSGAS
jgi:hypothetical protein